MHIAAINRPRSLGYRVPGLRRAAARPAHVRAQTEQPGIHLYTASTTNGWKASITLEELGVPYTVHKVDLSAGEQKREEYLKVNPLGLIPATVGADAGGVHLFESGAAICYLAAKERRTRVGARRHQGPADTRDPQHRLLPQGHAKRGEVLSWLFFQTSEVGPVARSIVAPLVFGSVPTTKGLVEHSVARARGFLSVLDARLAQQDAGGWLAAGQYTLADIAHLGAVLLLSLPLGVALEEEHPHLAAWLQRLLSREAVRRGMRVPEEAGWLMEEAQRTEMLGRVRERARELGVQL